MQYLKMIGQIKQLMMNHIKSGIKHTNMHWIWQ